MDVYSDACVCVCVCMDSSLRPIHIECETITIRYVRNVNGVAEVILVYSLGPLAKNTDH